MNHVERFRAVMNFQPVDRLPRVEWATWWGETLDRWRREGLPQGLTDAFEICEHFGLDPYKQFWLPSRGAQCPQPVAHGSGIIEDVRQYETVLPHLYPRNEELIDAMRPWMDRQAHGDVVVWISMDGFFWFPRTLLGIERHLYAFYDQPDLIHRINQDLTDWIICTLQRISDVCPPAFMTFAEDMSYNHGPMLSKGLFDVFLAPYYRQVVPLLKEMGIIPIVDSDGDVTELMPWLGEVGIEGVLPLERQAGVDAGTLRRRHPHLRMIGHFDKMVMHRGVSAMRAEFERLLPVIRTGGFIPSVDHQTPPGVSLSRYREYLKLLEEYSAAAAH